MSTGAELTNPYAADVDRSRTGGRAVGVAGRALVAGAIGLGSIVTFAGTGFADEPNPVESGPGSAQGVNDDDAESSEAESSEAESSEAESSEAESSESDSPEAESQISVVTEGDPSDQQVQTEIAHRGSGRVLPVGPDALAEAPEPSASGDGQGALPALESESELPVEGVIDDDPRSVLEFYEQVANGSVEINGVQYYVIPPAPVEAVDASGEVEVSGGEASAEAAIDAQPEVEAGDPEGPVVQDAGAEPVEEAPAFTVRGPELGEVDVDFAFGERLGATAPFDLGQASYEEEGRIPLGENLNLDASSANTLTLLPSEGSVYLLGAPDGAEPADDGPSVDIDTSAIAALESTNRATLSTGTSRPSEPPTGDGRAVWNTAGVTAGVDVDAGVSGEGVSGTVTTPLEVFFDAGEDRPDGRWFVDVNAGLRPSLTFVPTGSDPEFTTFANGNAGFEIGDRRDGDGNFEDLDGDGLKPGAVAGVDFSAAYTNVDSGTVTVPTRTPGVTAEVPADTSQYRASVEGNVELREAQRKFEAGIEATGTVGFEGSSVRTNHGSSASGPDFFANAQVNGDVEVRTAPPGEDRVYGRVDANAALGVADGETTSAFQVTPRVGGEYTIGDTTLEPYVGYRVGATDGRDYDGVVAGLGTSFNAFDGRGNVGLEYSGANPDSGDDGVALAFNFVPGGARHTPEPEPVETSSVPLQVSYADVSLDDPVTVASPADFGDVVVAPPAPAAPAIPEPGRIVGNASALDGTVAAGFDLSPGEPVAVAPAVEEAPSEPLFKLPSVDVEPVDVELPDVELPEVELPEVELPEVELPEVELPDVEPIDIELPEIEPVNIALPEVEPADIQPVDIEPVDIEPFEIEPLDIVEPIEPIRFDDLSSTKYEPSPALFSGGGLPGFDVSSAPDLGSMSFGGGGLFG